MTSIMIFFFCACVLLPQLVTGNVPPPCVFPFIYREKSYSSCTTVDAGDKPWCATTANYDTSPKWKYCSITEYSGNTGGKSCVFPFSYKNRTFYTCTSEDAAMGRFWCATTGSYDKNKQWSYCADTRLVANYQGPCIFPFIYKGKSYSSCTTAGASTGKLWCSLASNYDANPRWTYCDPSEPRPCVFPFTFEGKSYSACTTEGSGDGQLWCATTNNYERDSKWKACSIQEYEGNSVGKACVFPFIYNGKIYNNCTNENISDGRFWCATTGNYDKDKEWSYCADTRLGPDQPCIFPFTYNGKSYWSCTEDGESRGKPWCSLTSNYNVDPRRIYCNSSAPPPCVFPFIYRQKSYSSCTTVDADDKPWCATTANYDMSPKWKFCSIKEYGGNSGGKSCFFPFAYKKRTFYTCTNEDAAMGRFWCATTGSYDKDKQWSYCADTRLVADSQGPCKFPFIYKGKSYSSCTTAGASTGKLWCSLASNYDANPRWTYCDPSEPRPCVFPFTFGGKSYSACTTEGAGDGLLWCATTNNYKRDSKWKACSIQEYEGNSLGKACVFPFIYKGRIYKTCTNKNISDGRFWCATTRNYDKDKEWSYCADTRLGPNQPNILVLYRRWRTRWETLVLSSQQLQRGSQKDILQLLRQRITGDRRNEE